MKTTSKIITAFAIGAAAGVIVGILFAPAKGEETRNNLREKGNKFQESISDKWNEGKSIVLEAENRFKQTLEELNSTAEKIKERLKKFV